MRLVATSDTHLEQPELPSGDVLIHCGDLINDGLETEFLMGVRWLAKQPHPIKLYVPGNHDRYAFDFRKAAFHTCWDYGIIPLVDDWRTFDNIKFYGFPWTNLWGKTAAYMLPPEELFDAERQIPTCDVLITHGPPNGIYDVGRHGMPLGSGGLLQRVADIQPAIHLFGHIHEGHGGRRWHTWPNGKKTLFANVAACGSKVMGLMLNCDSILEIDIEQEADGILKISVDGNEVLT